MSIALVRFGCILLLITPSAVVLLVWIGVCGWGWPISLSICRRWTASFALINIAPSSASAAEDVNALMMVAIVRIVPLLGGDFLLFDKKKYPPAQLCDFFLLAYPASLWTANIILLALYVIIVSSCVVQ